jgi:putative addiction module component (TIGR02574 family)
MATLLEQALRLPVIDRRRLADDIYDSIAHEADSFELSEEQKAELDRRLAEYEKDPSIAIPVKDFLSRFESR